MELHIFTPEELRPANKKRRSITIKRSGLITLSKDLSELIVYGNLGLAKDTATKGPIKDWYLVDSTNALFTTRQLTNKQLAFNNKALAALFLDEFAISDKSINLQIGEAITINSGYAWPIITAAINVKGGKP
jgi:hypothetical protein